MYFFQTKGCLFILCECFCNCIARDGGGRRGDPDGLPPDPGQGGARQPDVEAGRHQHQLQHRRLLSGDEPVERPGEYCTSEL